MDKNDKENEQPRNKKSKLSLSLPKKGSKRFKKVSSDDINELSKVKLPKNTNASTRWAMKNFTDWFNEHNAENPEDKCPEEVLLPSCSPEILSRWLCVYVAETRSHLGESYPPTTLYSLLSGILRYMRSENPAYPNFLDKNNSDFATLTVTIDNIFKDLRAEGIGANAKHTEGISREEEMQLWSSNVLNVDTPFGLLRAVFFYNGKCLCLRGGQEHRELRISQFEKISPEKYVYRENSSKNRKGGLKELRLEHKMVSVIRDPQAGFRCHFALLDLYIQKLPPEAVSKDLFYCRPLSSVSSTTSFWYSAVPVGRNMLSKMVSSMCDEAGIGGEKSNHSLRVTGASHMFEAGVPERIIQGRTGHRSLDALRTYERVTEEQESMVSKILSGTSDKFVQEVGDCSNTTLADVKEPPQLTNTSPVDVKEPSQSAAKFICPSSSKPPPLLPVSETPSKSNDSTGAPQYNYCTVNMYQMSPPSNFPPLWPGMLYFPPPPLPPCPFPSSGEPVLPCGFSLPRAFEEDDNC